MDCGPTCLYIICKYYKVDIFIGKLRELTEIGKEGVNMLVISDAAERISFVTRKIVQYHEGLVAQGEIITADTKLSDRLFYQLRELLQKR